MTYATIHNAQAFAANVGPSSSTPAAHALAPKPATAPYIAARGAWAAAQRAHLRRGKAVAVAVSLVVWRWL